VRLGIAALLVVLASCGSSAAAPGGSPASPSATTSARHCGPSGATTLASSSQARVYSSGGGVYGCSFAAGRSFRLGSAARSLHEGRVAPVVLAGSDVAYGLATFGVDTGRTGVVVRRLTDGTQLADFASTQAGVVEGFQSIGSLVVKRDGAVAWIGVERSIVGSRQVVEVHGAPAGASTDRLLGSGAQIAPSSLRLHGSTLTWRDGGATRHATLR